MFHVCLFDLDDTLLHTADLDTIRPAGKANNDPAYVALVVAELNKDPLRHIYSLAALQQIRASFPDMKIGVFTRSPRSYALTVLQWAYPGFTWDVVVAYEDVTRTKPFGDGIDKVIQLFEVKNFDEIILVGDSDVDVRAAYHCGCLVALDKQAWPYKWRNEHWRALEHMPDVILSSPNHIEAVLADYRPYLPEVERELARVPRAFTAPRFDRIGHFVAKAAGGDNTAYPIHVGGRSFSNYDSMKYRRKWHELTHSIDSNKDSDVFPDAWVSAVRSFLAHNFLGFFGAGVGVSVVPHRPGRKARLENFLAQLQQALAAAPIPGLTVSFHPDLLAYKGGVKSQHNDHLSRDERFINVRDHLNVNQAAFQASGKKSFLVIDDVVTTGASLIYAQIYLKQLGAGDVKLFGMAKNVGNLV